MAGRFPGVGLASDLDELLADDSLDAVALATPVPTHAELTVRVLKAGKHCFVEKPLAQSVADAERSVAAADASGRVLMVGHLLEYHPGLQKLKELTESGELGEQIYYIYGNRLNLGQVRADENALWSLGAHDVSVVLNLAGEEPFEDARHMASRTCARGSRTWSSASCVSPPACPRTCTCRGSTRTRNDVSPSLVLDAWPRLTTWRSRAN